MSAATENQGPPDRLVEILDDLDAPTLRVVHTYVEQRVDDLRPSLQNLIRSETNGRVVDIEDRGTYTLVRKCPPSQSDSGTASSPLSLYRVKREKQLNGEESLRWSYLGDVTGGECGNCGTPVNTHEVACPHCGEGMDDGNEEV